MLKLVTGAQMRALEKRHMQSTGESGLTLMRRASRETALALASLLHGAEGRVCAFACGSGGNGGDGYGAAAEFARMGGRSIVLELFPDRERTPNAAIMRAEAMARKDIWFTDRIDGMPRPAAWVDSIFGIGLDRCPSGEAQLVIERMNADRTKGSLLLACDIPSGLNADTGKAFPVCIEADRTVTFECRKAGHVLLDGPDMCGELLVRSIGIDPALFPDNAVRLAEPSDLRAVCAPRRHNTHKGTYGHLLIVAGSFGMAGAACLCANAALRSGAGLVSVACPQSIVPIVQTLAPCAVCVPLPEQNGAISADALPALTAALQGKTAAAVGPGLSRRCSTEIVSAVLRSGLPVIADADALNIVSDAHLQPLLSGNTVITPHPGEAARLTPLPADDPVAAAKALQGTGCIALYKGAATVIAGSSVTVSTSGTPGMAKGGSGDVLTGILGALLARGIDPETAAILASEAHGLAGEAAAHDLGEIAMTATDLIDRLHEVWSRAY